MIDNASEFPKFKIFIEDEALAYYGGSRENNQQLHSSHCNGDTALEATMIERPMTREEHNAIIDAADEWDAAK